MNEAEYWKTLIMLLTRVTVALEKIAEEAREMRQIEAAQHGPR
jgi:hypothetical protein